MSTLRVEVGRCRTRVDAGRAGPERRERLLRLQREALGEPLALALEAVGLRDDHLVCVRRLRVRLRADPCAADAAVVRGLAARVAEALLAARASGEMVVYPTRAHAVADLVRSVAAGAPERAWAWTQLGLWSEPDGCTGGEAALAALQAEPRAIVPLLAALAADPPAFGRLAARLPAGGWRALARAALRAAGLDPAALDRAAAPPTAETRGAPGAGAERGAPEIHPAHRARLDAALRGSRILAALRGAGAGEPAAAALALLEADPGLLCLGTAPAALLRAAGPSGAPGDPAPVPDGAGPPRPGSAPRPGGARADPAATARGRHPPAPVRRPAAPADPHVEPEPPRSVDDGRRRGDTAHAGLLFLLPVLGELLATVPDRAPAERPLRWTLHRLGGILAPDAPGDDPARLAFCGLPPGAPPPDAEAPPAEARERALLGALAAGLRREVAERLGCPRREADGALAALVRRRGRVVADPGWFEVVLSLDEVATDVRRAGLDCDPGWLPWLGVVIRFRYE